MELDTVIFGPYTKNEVPEPLYIRVYRSLRGGGTEPMKLHNQTPSWSAKIVLEPPGGLSPVQRSATIVDPQTLPSDEAGSFDEAEDGWVRVDWASGDFSEEGTYSLQLVLDNGTLLLKSTALYQPTVVPGPAADVTLDA